MPPSQLSNTKLPISNSSYIKDTTNIPDLEQRSSSHHRHHKHRHHHHHTNTKESAIPTLEKNSSSCNRHHHTHRQGSHNEDPDDGIISNTISFNTYV